MKEKYPKRLRPQSNILFTCEHASGRIPREYGTLGLTRHDLMHSKDWYDIGALDLMKRLADIHGASYIHATFSRLVIDSNRRRDSIISSENLHYTPALKQSLLVEDGEGEREIPIPFNNGKNPEKEGIRRWDTLVRPYHTEGRELIKKLKRLHDRVYVISVHTFHPVYKGDVRDVDIDVISDTPYSDGVAKKIIAYLREHTAFSIEHNKPWGMKAIKGGIWGSEEEKGDICLLPFDINHKHLLNKKSFNRIANLISQSLREVLER